MSDTICRIEQVKKDYEAFRALHGIDLTVEAGEFIALVGPSGSGKSTLLQLISGFETPTEGRILIDGEDMTRVPPSQRPTSMVFQKLALFPHKTVEDNIGFPLKLKKVPKAEIATRVSEIMALMELKPVYRSRYPAQLSGGEQQRVALARSMIQHPKLLLLDEPLSALDVNLKKVLQAEIKRLHRSLGITFIHVTHDLEEAMMLSDHICVMRDGRILQMGTPDEIYYRPADRFVAEFIGDTNLFPVRIDQIDEHGLASYAAELSGGLRGQSSLNGKRGAYTVGAKTQMMVRPEFIRIARDRRELDVTVETVVSETFNHGSTTQIKAVSKKDGYLLTTEISGHLDRSVRIGESLILGWNTADAYILPAGEKSA